MKSGLVCRSHFLAILALACSPAAVARERIAQLAEDGVVTRHVLSTPDSAFAPILTRVCEPGARWIRVGFEDLHLAGYDSLVLTSTGGDQALFEGDAWNGRAFSARALRGECVEISAYFNSAQSNYSLASYQFGNLDLDATQVVVAGAGDICDTNKSTCSATSDLIVAINPTAVFTAGDNAYDSGTIAQYNSNYAPTWGRFKDLTNPTPGNHDYLTTNASGYFDYFNGAGNQSGPAGDRSKGYYSWNVGDWHFIALNSMSGGTIATAQLDWLSADLAANTKPCTAAYWHHPLLSHGGYTGYAQVKPFWDRLYAAHADLVLVGHDHNYQRYAPMDPAKAADAGGIRQVLVGSGGRAFYALVANSDSRLEASNDNSHGVLKLTLTAAGYAGEFVRSSGTFSDSFNGSCHNGVSDRIFANAFDNP